MKYCLNCDWSASRTANVDEQEQSRAAVDHFVETGHWIESVAESSAGDGDRPPEFDSENAAQIPVTGVRENE